MINASMHARRSQAFFSLRTHCHMTVNTSIQTRKIGHRNFGSYCAPFCIAAGYRASIQKKTFFLYMLHKSSSNIYC